MGKKEHQQQLIYFQAFYIKASGGATVPKEKDFHSMDLGAESF